MTKDRKTKGGPDYVDKHVGHRLKVRRSLMGMSQEKLAEFVGVTFQQIQKYERGMNRVSSGRLFQLSKILGVPVDYFFENVDDNKGSDQAVGMADNGQAGFSKSENIMDRKETIELVRNYYKLDEKARQNLMKFIKSVAS